MTRSAPSSRSSSGPRRAPRRRGRGGGRAGAARSASRARLELAALRPFVLRLGPAELFPTPRRPRVVAIGLEPAAPLAELAGAVERAGVAEGLAPPERA